jgi:hypothetical protein
MADACRKPAALRYCRGCGHAVAGGNMLTVLEHCSRTHGVEFYAAVSPPRVAALIRAASVDLGRVVIITNYRDHEVTDVHDAIRTLVRSTIDEAALQRGPRRSRAVERCMGAELLLLVYASPVRIADVLHRTTQLLEDACGGAAWRRGAVRLVVLSTHGQLSGEQASYCVANLLSRLAQRRPRPRHGDDGAVPFVARDAAGSASVRLSRLPSLEGAASPVVDHVTCPVYIVTGCAALGRNMATMYGARHLLLPYR